METDHTYTAFVGNNLLVSGDREQVLTAMKSRFEHGDNPLFLTFEDQTGREVDFDLRGTLAEVLERAKPDQARIRPGRPKLGVVAREVSLLPRHWEWLEEQPNGASAAIRRLVDEARKREPGERQIRAAMEAASRFLSGMAGNLPGYEEASRALYARDGERFAELIRDWPYDIRTHVQRLVCGVF